MILLGKRRPKFDKRTLQLEKYVKPSLILTPNTLDYGCRYVEKVGRDWKQLGNDRFGCCVYSAQGHKLQLDTSIGGNPVTLADSQVLEAYARDTGFDPSNGANDNGANMLDALVAWRKHGIGGHKILAFAAIDPKNDRLSRIASFLFGGLYVGYALPRTVQGQRIWDFERSDGDGKPYSWGGHALWEHRYSTKNARKGMITWGYDQDATLKFKNEYCDEQYAVITEEWFDGNVAINGFDRDELFADLRSVTQ